MLLRPGEARMGAGLAIEVELLSEDWEAIRSLVSASGLEAHAELSRLLEIGLDGFVQDELEWETMEGRTDEAAQVRRQELQRREAHALLVSMRASTISAEIEMRGLSDRVGMSADEMETHRQTLWSLRLENEALETRLSNLGDRRHRHA